MQKVKVATIGRNSLWNEAFGALIERDPEYDAVGFGSSLTCDLIAAVSAASPAAILLDCQLLDNCQVDASPLGDIAPVLVVLDPTHHQKAACRRSHLRSGLRPAPHSRECERALYCIHSPACSWNVFSNNSTGAVLQLAVQCTIAGRRFLDSDFEGFCSATASNDQSLSYSPGETRLSLREKTIAEAVGRGLSNKEIAQSLGIAYPTVKNHIASIMHKLSARSRVDIVRELSNLN